MHARITDHLICMPRAFLHITDEESGADDEAPAQVKRKQKWTSGKLRIANTTVVNQITLPHEVIYTRLDSQLSMKNSTAWHLSMGT